MDSLCLGDQHLAKFYEDTKGMTPAERAEYMEKDSVSLGYFTLYSTPHLKI